MTNEQREFIDTLDLASKFTMVEDSELLEALAKY